ncbi:MAG: DUF4339 domain-containing protein [Planctomycetales bacterium]|nr:DUF4339 domain-containing protein [Planctomycetales bacterium]
MLIPTESQLPADAPKYRPTAEATESKATALVAASVKEANPVIQHPVIAAEKAEAPADPIAESPDSVWYVRPSAGGQYGPARGDVMRRWLSEGRVSADSMVWREGWEDWKLAGPVFPSLDTAPSSTKPAVIKPAPSFLVPEDEEQDISKPVAAPARRVAAAKKKSIAPLIILGLLIVVLLVVTVVVLRGV